MSDCIDSLGQVCAIIGAQYGDEGKGKLTHFLADEYSVIARGCGGPNTTHTTVVNGKKFKFQMLPSGYFGDGNIIVLGSGMVIDLPTLLTEISALQEVGVDVLPNLYISPRAHILFNHHRVMDDWLALDGAENERGVTCAYMHKIMKIGMRMEQLRGEKDDLRASLEAQTNSIRRWTNGEVDIDPEEEYHGLLAARELFYKRLILSIPELLHMFLESGKKILIEGARASQLDIDHGSYPHVTSTTSTLAGSLQGLGLAPKHIDCCIGVTKPYCTRSDGGEMPTEDESCEKALRPHLEKIGDEDAERRIGWLYLPDVHYGTTLNGFDMLALSKLDVLDGLDEIRIGVGYDANGDIRYESLPVWSGSIKGATNKNDLPKEALDMFAFIEEHTETPIRLAGTGPEQDNIVCL